MADNIAITPGAGAIAAADEVTYSGDSTALVQLTRRVGVTGTEGAKTVIEIVEKASRADTYTGAASGTTVDVSMQGLSHFGIQVKGTGAEPTSWTAVLEVSLDGTNFTTLITHSNTTDADGSMKYAPGGGGYPALYFRSRCSAVALGGATNIVVTIIGTP